MPCAPLVMTATAVQAELVYRLPLSPSWAALAVGDVLAELMSASEWSGLPSVAAGPAPVRASSPSMSGDVPVVEVHVSLNATAGRPFERGQEPSPTVMTEAG